MRIYFFNSLPNGECSNLLIVAAFSSKSFSVKASFPATNSFFRAFPNDKTGIWPIFFLNGIELCHFIQLLFYNGFFLNINGLFDGKSYRSLKVIMVRYYNLCRTL